MQPGCELALEWRGQRHPGAAQGQLEQAADGEGSPPAQARTAEDDDRDGAPECDFENAGDQPEGDPVRVLHRSAVALVA